MTATAGPAREPPSRAEVRTWLEQNFPPSLNGRRAPFNDSPEALAANHDHQLWLARVVPTGWGAATWPRDVGGAGLSVEQAQAVEEEFLRAGAYNPLYGIGRMMLGPTLLEFGTPGQITEHVPKIARGEVRWCQGFSEPGAGSDLASLTTSAEDRGDHWRVQGHKIWTSVAHYADWCFCLVRTDPTRKQSGITMLMIDMRTPGITARPIRLINGDTHFSEVFFDDVRVPKDNVLGAVNAGWGVAKRLMEHERGGLSAAFPAGESLVPLARAHVGVNDAGQIADADLRARMIDHAARSQAYRLTLDRAELEGEAGLAGRPPVSVLKNLGARVAQRHFELKVEILGADGIADPESATPEAERAIERWLFSKAFSIFAGSHEVQNNVTAKLVLGLPQQG